MTRTLQTPRYQRLLLSQHKIHLQRLTYRLSALSGLPTSVDTTSLAEVKAIARRKAHPHGMHIAWMQGFSLALPYPYETFDRVVASLMLHYLNRKQKRL